MSPEITVAAASDSVRRAQEDHWSIRWTLILLATLSVGLLVVVPLANVFYNALSNGLAAYWKNLFGDPDTRHAILLTLTVAPAAVVANVTFGVAAAWLIARFRFPGRTLLTTLIDLPFSVSPVVAGLVFVLIFGLQGYLGPWLREHDVKIIFATPGLILATAFVTFPFVARELIPLMEAIGAEEDVAAVSLGARGWQMFRRVTLPNIKWGLIYGVILCSARALGEFGAVYVVSGHIAGQTDTMPLRVEKLFQEYNTPGSFAVASLLTSLALVTLGLKTAAEWKTRGDLASRRRESLVEETQVAGAGGATRTPPEVGVPASGGPRTTRRKAGFHPDKEAHVGITVDNVSKQFGDFVALDRINLEIPDGELLALLGPSGCGKTTLLRIIAGLDAPTEGGIRYHDEDATQRHARERNVGFVFQHYALFRHMSVFENVAFGLRVRGAAEEGIRNRVHELLRLVQLDGLEGQSPTQLSGGQRQRVALARALAAEPKVLLLDEPFGALDARVRKELRQWLRRLHDELHVTSVFVTHDQEEAFEVADRVVVMNHGRIEQIGTPEEVFEHPANPFILDFLGNVNVFHGRAEAGRAFLAALDQTSVDRPQAELETVTAYVRPHELEIERASRGSSSLRADVVRINAASAAVRVELFAEDFGIPIHVELARERHAQLQLRTGDRVYVHPKNVRVFIEDYQI